MRVSAAVLALTLGLGAVGMASAEESENWFSRWFAVGSGKSDSEKTVEEKESADKAAKLASVRRAVRLAKQAEADWVRRVAVCDKIKAIATESGDDSLRQRAEHLEQRAWETYLATKKSPAELESMVPEPNAKKGSRK